MIAQQYKVVHRLRELLVGICEVIEEQNVEISGLSLNSREVSRGDLFFACQGERVHGFDYIDDAINRGASAVITDEVKLRNENREWSIPVFGVYSAYQYTSRIANLFYGEPSRKLIIVGITGTNGKTSVSHFLAHAITFAQDTYQKCGVIGTLGHGLYGQLDTGQHTTPDALTLHKYLADIHDKGARYVMMEVSSHALMQGRVNGVNFNIAVFTNLSHDHLDYHGDMPAYIAAKYELFKMPGLKTVVVNVDDPVALSVTDLIDENVDVIGFGMGGIKDKKHSLMSTVRGKDLVWNLDGLTMTIESAFGNGNITSKLFGEYNASNLLATCSVLLAIGWPIEAVIRALAETEPVEGRMETISKNDKFPLIIIDYAHTPDALKNVLLTIRKVCSGKVWCVFGCGGDRDKEKRRTMGAIAKQLADHVILTDDNPRYEDPKAIINDIQAGIATNENFFIEHDRRNAIEYAIRHAGRDDVVLVAGKGHEKYQQIENKRLPFSDQDIAKRFLAQAG